MSEQLRIEEYSGKEASLYLQKLAHLRIEVFKQWPYLYEGNSFYEFEYLQRYIDSNDSIIALVFDGKELVGATTGLPLSDEDQDFQKPFLDFSYPIETIFYFGESIILPKYRGQGVGKKFFDIREKHAQKVLPNLSYTCFCSVKRPDNHPLKPTSYRSLAKFWQNQDYRKKPDLVAHYSWKDVDQHQETKKPLVFWLKQWS